MDTQTLMAALSRATVERMQVQDALAQAQARIVELEAKLGEGEADNAKSGKGETDNAGGSAE